MARFEKKNQINLTYRCPENKISVGLQTRGKPNKNYRIENPTSNTI
jgi:hypothetical protein